MSKLQYVIWTLLVLAAAALVANQSSRRTVRQATRRVERQMAQVLEQNEHNKSLIREVMETVRATLHANSLGE
jgi:hypothetical protein